MFKSLDRYSQKKKMALPDPTAPLTLEEMNYQLSSGLLSFRAIAEVAWTPEEAAWVAEAGLFAYPRTSGIVYVDSLFNRFVRLSNGQIFECTNKDLLAMSRIDKANLVAYYTGLID